MAAIDDAVTSFTNTLTSALDAEETAIKTEIAAVSLQLQSSGDTTAAVAALGALQKSVETRIGGLTTILNDETAKLAPAAAPAPAPAPTGTN